MAASRKRSWECMSNGGGGGGGGGSGEDRLSDLPDGVLGHILSFLPTKEAGRAAVLSRRWRHMFANVHTMSFEQAPVMHQDDDCTFYYQSQERRSLNGAFLDDVAAAVLCRRRCGGAAPNASLRAFRVVFDAYHRWDEPMVQPLLAHVLQQSKEELRLDLRFRSGELCDVRGDVDRYGDGPPPWYPRLPRRLFSCAPLRSLRVGHCRLGPPEAVALPSLEALHLTGVDDPCAAIQRLVSGCPRLANLTLEACPNLKRLAVPGATRLRRLALRCFHHEFRVTVDGSELTAFDFVGGRSAEWLLTLRGSPRAASCAVEFCDPKLSKEEVFSTFRALLGSFAGAEQLHLRSSRLCHGLAREPSSSMDHLPAFPSLRRLELSRGLEDRGVAAAVARILERAPSLESLSLFLAPRRAMSVGGMRWRDRSTAHDAQPVGTPPPACLRQRVREMRLVHYRGSEAQRRMARLLLCNALALQELTVVFAPGPDELRSILTNELKGWMANRSARMVCR
ncbi:hypothetical protein ACP4OV_020423 [Aristida adscensionis]